MMLSENFKRLK